MGDSAAYLKELQQNLTDCFNWSEIEDLCLRLNIEYETAPGTGKSRWLRGILFALGRDGRLPELVAIAREERPDVVWPPVPDDFEPPSSIDEEMVWDGRVPYPGLRAFRESARDAQFFFGRESLVDDLLERVQKASFIVIAGPSGSGKSSVARAGLFYALSKEGIEGSDEWVLATMSPKDDPLENLALAMASAVKSPAAGDHIRENGLTNPLALHEQAEALLSDDERQRCVLLVDQFEEIFTQTKDEEKREAFLTLLTAAAQVEDGRTIVLLSLRSDFVSNCAQYPKLSDLLSQDFLLVRAMKAEDLGKAITLPTLAVGAQIDPALVKQIIDDMKGQPDALPLMSFALRDLFMAQESAIGKPMQLTLQEYVERGGIDKALQRHADHVLESFSEEQQVLAKNVFSKLITVGSKGDDTRRTAVFSELVPADANPQGVAAVIDKLAAADVRLVTTSSLQGDEALTAVEIASNELASNKLASNELASDRLAANELAYAQTTVTIAHEKLIDAWPWLRQLIDENRELIALQNQINGDAQAWAVEEDAGFLYRGGRLLHVEENLQELQPSMDELSLRFIQASIDERQRLIDEKETQRRRELEQAQQLAEQAQQLAEEEQRRSTLFRQLAEEEQRRSTLFRRALIGGSLLALFLLTALIFAGVQTNNANTNLNTSNARGTEAANEANAARTAEVKAEAETTRAVSAEQDALNAQGTVEAEKQRAEVQTTRAVSAEQDALDAQRTAEAERVEALVQSERALAQSLQANSRALVANEPNNQDLAQARLLAVEGVKIAGRVGSAAEKSSSSSLLFSLAHEQTIPYQAQTTLTDESSWISSVAWNKDGSRLASASSSFDESVIIWDTESGEAQTFLYDHTYPVKSMAWNEDGSRLASASRDGIIIIWDTDNWQPQQTLVGHSDWVSSVAWNIDGSRLASATAEGTVIIWDTESWQPQQTLVGHSDWVNSVTWNNDGSRLASASRDGTIIIWDTESWQPQTTLAGHTELVNSVAWNNDNSRLASASDDGRIIIWDTAIWQPYKTLVGSTDRVNSVDWNNDGSRLASASNDNSIIIWDTENWQPQPTLTNHRAGVRSVAWNEVDDRLASTSYGEIIIWDTPSWQSTTTLTDHTTSVNSVAWSENGDRLASTSCAYDDVSGCIIGEIIVWDATSWQPSSTLTAHTDAVLSANWNEDGSQLASGSDDNSVIIWDTESWQPLENLTEHRNLIYDVAWNKDGSRFASASLDPAIIIYDTSDWEPLAALADERWESSSIAWNEDGSLIASTSGGEVIIWDTASQQPRVTLTDHNDRVYDVAWNKDESLLASASCGRRDADIECAQGEIIIWDTAAWQPLRILTGHTGRVMSVAWNDNDTLLASASWDRTIIIWDTSSWQPQATLTNHADQVNSVAWHEDGSRLASASDDGTVIIWEYPDFSRLNCQLAGRNLSLAEWEQYLPGVVYRCTCEEWPAGEGASYDAPKCVQR